LFRISVRFADTWLQEFDRLDLSTNPFLEKHLEFLIESIDDLMAEQARILSLSIAHLSWLTSEQAKMLHYHRVLQRNAQVLAKKARLPQRDMWAMSDGEWGCAEGREEDGRGGGRRDGNGPQARSDGACSLSVSVSLVYPMMLHNSCPISERSQCGRGADNLQP
jgi:hypothetical protein